MDSVALAAVCAILGRIPTFDEYMLYMGTIDTMAGDIYRYMNFDQIPEYREVADKVIAAVVA